MRPADQRPGKPRGSRNKVGRRIATRLRLLRGMPAGEPLTPAGGLAWRLIPRAGEADEILRIEIRADDLKTARLELRRLRIDYPRAYPAVVGDVGEFEARANARLDAIEGLLAGRPAESIRTLAVRFGTRESDREQLLELAERRDRRTWCEALLWQLEDASALRKGLRIVDEFGELLSACRSLPDLSGSAEVAAWWAFAILRADDPARIAAVLRFVTDELAATRLLGTNQRAVQPAGGFAKRVAAAPPGSRRAAVFLDPLLTSGQPPRTALLEMITIWGRTERTARRHLGGLVDVLTPRAAVRSTARRLARIRRIADRLSEGEVAGDRDLRGLLHRCVDRLPRSALAELRTGIGRVQLTELRRFASACAAIPEGVGREHWRAKLFAHWLELPIKYREPELDALRDHQIASAGDREALLAPWRDGRWHSGNRWEQDDVLLHAPRLFELFRTARARELPTPGRGWPLSAEGFWSTAAEWRDDHEVLFRLMPAIRDLPEATDPENTWWLAPTLRMASGDRDRLRGLIAALPSWRDHAGALWEIRTSGAALQLAGEAILERDFAWLRRFSAYVRSRIHWDDPPAKRRALIATLDEIAGRSLPARDELDAQWRDLPESLREAAGRLLATADHAESQLRGILGRHLRSDAALLEEAEAIESRIASAPPERRGGMQQRSAALRSRVDMPPSPRQLARALAAIQRHARSNWRKRLLDEFVHTFRRVGFDTLDPGRRTSLEARCRDDRRVVALAGPVLELAEPWRNLGLGLLLGNPCAAAGLADHENNRNWLRTLGDRSLQLEHWLGGARERRFTHDGQDYVLSLATDPLDVLSMGAPFNTCLSPGQMNFFSAVANAVDVNKRVLFAHDAMGQVQGRCLLALTDAGCLLTFHVYAHHPELRLQERFVDYVEDLANDIGAAIAARGDVTALVGDTWYDDGPEDLTGRLVWSHDDSEFVRALRSGTSAEVLALFNVHVGAHRAAGSEWSVLAEMDVFVTRPELLMPLAPLLLGHGGPYELLTLGRRAVAAERLDIAKQTLARLQRDLSRLEDWQYHELVTLALPVDPLFALRLLRRRAPPRHLREARGAWLRQTGDALAALGRRRRAERAWRSAERVRGSY